MTRSQLEHIIRAAGTIADDEDIVVVGSQATLGEFPEAPEELLVSREAVVYPRTHGVGPETAVLPAGWEGRLVMVSNANTRFVRGWCLEVHDLAISKLVAGREKDLDFVGALGRHGMARGARCWSKLDAQDRFETDVCVSGRDGVPRAS